MNDTDKVAFPDEISSTLGALGIVRGAPAIVIDESPLPISFTWRTCTAYVVPFVKPLIVMGDESVGATDHVDPPSREYSFRITARPPELPAVNEIDRPPFVPATDETVGCSGVLAGITVRVGDSGPAPAEFTARMRTS